MMLKKLALVFFTILIMVSCAVIPKNTSVKTMHLKASDFEGNWKGTMRWIVPDKQFEKTIPVTIEIKPLTGFGGIWEWNTFYYDSAGTIAKKYLLKTIDSISGRFVIDELNSVVLHENLVENSFYSSYLVGNTLFFTQIELNKNNLNQTITGFSNQKADTTGLQTGYTIVSHRFLFIQKSELKKVD